MLNVMLFSLAFSVTASEAMSTLSSLSTSNHLFGLWIQRPFCLNADPVRLTTTDVTGGDVTACCCMSPGPATALQLFATVLRGEGVHSFVWKRSDQFVQPRLQQAWFCTIQPS
jgi:hypothetical protein